MRGFAGCRTAPATDGWRAARARPSCRHTAPHLRNKFRPGRFADGLTRFAPRIRWRCSRWTSWLKQARFSAVKRHYRYRIVNTLVLDCGHAGACRAGSMRTRTHGGTTPALGKHDFTAPSAGLRARQCPRRALDDVPLWDGREITILTSARLHSQVCSMVGSLMVGRRRPLDRGPQPRLPRAAAACGIVARRTVCRWIIDGVRARALATSTTCSAPTWGIQTPRLSAQSLPSRNTDFAPSKLGHDSGVWAGSRAYPKYLATIPRYTLVSCSRSATDAVSLHLGAWSGRPQLCNSRSGKSSRSSAHPRCRLRSTAPACGPVTSSHRGYRQFGERAGLGHQQLFQGPSEGSPDHGGRGRRLPQALVSRVSPVAQARSAAGCRCSGC